MISDVLRLEDSRPEVARLSQHATEGYVHLSSLINFCARQYALAARSGEQHINRVTGGHRVMWKIGRAVEEHVREQFLAGMEKRYVFGRWQCLCTSHSRVGYYEADSGVCEYCGTRAENYKEQPIEDHNAKITGSCDMPVLVGDRIVPVEIKSTDKEQEELQAMTAPMPDHVFQVAGYHRLYGWSGVPVHDHCRILYVQKRFKWGDPYKEFIVPMADAQVEGLLDRAWTEAGELVLSQASGVLPDRICTSTGLTRAKQCPMVGLCFNSRG